MINTLFEVIKILHEEMLNAIYWYWFHNDISKENNSLNGHSNEPNTLSSYFLLNNIFLGITKSDFARIL